MNRSRSHKSKAALAIAVFGALLAWYSQRNADKSPPARAPAPAVPSDNGRPSPPVRDQAPGAPAAFDFYLLALSIHPAFCADGNQRKSECRHGGARPLVIHGLWPENLEPGAYPHDCPASRLALEPALAQDLSDYMPGMESNLHEHEWRKHGGCSGLGDDDYFQRSLDLTRELDHALGPTLTTLTGRETNASALRAAANRVQAGVGATFTLHCRSLRGSQIRAQFLTEVRQCIDNDGGNGAPGTLLDCATVNRRDQGCGRSFRIAEQTR